MGLMNAGDASGGDPEIRRSVEATTPLRAGHSKDNGIIRNRELHQALALWIATLVIWLPWLGNVPLRDWDEGIVAGVARATVQQDGLSWLLPLKATRVPYLNKPPGVHWLIGSAIQTWGESEWAVRLAPALLSTLAVPLLVWVRRELGRDQQGELAAVLAGAVLMTLLPMARHGRLAMLDGSLVSCSLLVWLGWIGSRRQPARGLVAGLGGSGVLLLKPPALVGFAVICLAITAVEWFRSLIREPERPKRGTVFPGPLAAGFILLGLTPGIAWHFWHGWWRGSEALLMWSGQGLNRVTTVVGGNQGSWLIPLTEVLEGGWPWLMLLPAGWAWAWRHRRCTFGLWELGLLLGSAALVLPLRTQLPWYSHLLWPAIALLCGEGLSLLLLQGQPRWVPRAWQMSGASLLLIIMVRGILLSGLSLPTAALLIAGAGLLLGGRWLASATQRRRRWGLLMLLLGWSLALLSLWHSRLWLWELNESWDPRPVAARIQLLPENTMVWLEGPTRPALAWYAGRILRRYQKQSQPKGEHWLVSDRRMPECRLAAEPVEGYWQLWRCD